MGSYTEAIPFVDLTKASSNPKSSSWKDTSNLVRRALETYGCLVVSDETARPDLLQDSLVGALSDAFALPDDTKKKHTSEFVGFGYGGKYPKMPFFEYFGIEDEGNLQGLRNFIDLLWPHGNDKFYEGMCSYRKLLLQLNEMIMEMVVSSYGLEKYHDSLAESAFYMLRLLKYNSPNSDESHMGLRPHKDKGFITVIGSNEVEGLQLQSRDGLWTDFEPSPSKFLVLAGEALMAWSNGRIHSPTHRVMTRGFKERYSCGMFSFVRGVVQVPQELVDDENPLKFKPFDNIDFVQHCSDGRSTINNAIRDYCGI